MIKLNLEVLKDYFELIKRLISLYTLIVAHSFAIGVAEGQSVVQGNEKFTNGLISATPNFSGGGTFGLMQEWCNQNKQFSFNASVDYEIRTADYKAYYFRPGIRYYYKKNNTGLFHGASILAAYEENPMPWKSAFGYGLGLTYLGFRYIFKNGIILEADGFAGLGNARITERNNDLFTQGRYYFISNIRLGYRLKAKSKM
ncbi:MAG: hypothetical protein KF687_01770 [Cyclobacteriaceae bacterium]|nr:hypothetical protein [Cyclobacteriaceae bacterium]